MSLIHPKLLISLLPACINSRNKRGRKKRFCHILSYFLDERF
jgi:hypothetical protein